MNKALPILLVFIFISTGECQADAVDNSYRLCSVFDKTDSLSRPCEVTSGSERGIKITLATSASEARKICSQAATMMERNNIMFEKGYKIRVYSPYSNGNTIAYCNLPY